MINNTLFPSKLVDYTSLGLPVIIHAPKISSMVQFAHNSMDIPFAKVITDETEASLEQAINALVDKKHRKRLGANSLKIWHKFFAPTVVRESFFEKL